MRIPNLLNGLILLESVSLHWGCFPSLHFIPLLLILCGRAPTLLITSRVIAKLAI